MKDLFTASELERLKETVADAERRTSGEIVPYIVPRSDRYDISLWRGASLMAMAAICLSGLAFQFYRGWGLSWLYTGAGMAVTLMAAGAAGALLGAYVPSVKRFLAGSALMTRTVHHRAMRAFVEEEVFNTRDRTGILLFVSLLEHRIEVLGDAGINRLVSADDWTEVVACIRDGIKKKQLADGLISAIGLCGQLLERRGVEIQPDDTDELPNEVRFSDDE